MNNPVPFVGIQVEMLPSGNSEPVAQAVCVTRVIAGSPAAKSGIQPGDTVLNVGRAPVNDRGTLIGALSNYKPGDTITLKISREGKSHRVKITLSERQIPALKFRPVEQQLGS